MNKTSRAGFTATVGIGAMLLFALPSGHAATPAPHSANYKLATYSVGASGASVSPVTHSVNYILKVAAVGQGIIGKTTSTNYRLVAGYVATLPDSDGDQVKDIADNCILEPNSNQRNSNAGSGAGQDYIGNACDPDLDNNDRTNFGDLARLKSVFGQHWTPPDDVGPVADADLTGDGFVNFGDLARLKQYFTKKPGPSGQVPLLP